MHKILLIEDTLECQLVVNRALLNMEAHLVISATLDEAFICLKKAENDPFDLIVLDSSLPDGEGIEVLEYLHSNHPDHDAATILLTSNSDLSMKVAAFNLGAEDYLVKPINPIELRARIEMRLRKKKNRRASSKDCVRGMLTLDPSLMKARIQKANGDSEVDLTSKEFKILYRLALNHQKAFSRAELVKDVWGAKVHVLERTVDSHICAIRRKLGESFIECIPGVGYRFSYPESLQKTC